ncbi:2-succinyl-6-hydroxy-2,4-cyclohexadiene-1-carboxylate synthase [Vibrio sp. JC009]|uniref:2-succinyl-6-hydroxy-2, 4-cyclohexadiene-1-carboxylate synthase n=1 Tax=Vibrio sp. JC009 TaxID=2912314 RepID=UPI0023B0B060|nr:2-succinyl-6-hydroxy-2,4-cyclohexadiene-1-carboxylate synthase [Vibrio sp. JC009]WED22610.1 2-succinyl-6-hydroxy-2,4-cyclohexadiene-1-carboxylate synthase [Vibrio sp. JC009]
MLYNKFYSPLMSDNQEKPLLVFIHGLLGSGEDWKEVLDALEDYPRLTIDLPGHGKSTGCSADGFETICNQIAQAIKGLLSREKLPAGYPVILIGYSLGARLSMYGLAFERFSGLNLRYAFIEGGNFGLKTPDEKAVRMANDKAWAERFSSEPMEQVLENWYQQPVFSSLDAVARKKLVTKRAANHGKGVANMLISTSLAKQPYLLDKVKDIDVRLEYICGRKDNKFLELAAKSGLFYTVVQGAGHNVHKECPADFAQLIRTKLGDIQSPETNESTKLE